jgi:aerobic carbon-monoxide dehydrogenase medium subunit
VKLPPFVLHRPRSVSEASRVMIDLGDEAAMYCGGTELLLAMKLGLADYAHLVDLKRIDSLREVAEQGDGLRIGAAVTHYGLETSAPLRARYPEMVAMLSTVANLRVRCTGTLGGNLCFADPHSDPAAFLVAAGAFLLCQKGAETRRVGAHEFFQGPYQTVLEQGELLVAVELPARPAGTGMAHARMKLHERPVVTVAASVQLTGGVVTRARLAVGSAVPRPVAVRAADTVVGAGLAEFPARTADCAQQAASECTFTDTGDCSPQYLEHLVRVLSRQALSAAASAASDNARAGR